MENQQKLLPFIKIQYNESLFNLGNNINNFTELVEQTKFRFIENKQFQFIYENTLLKQVDFIKLLNKQILKNTKSFKLKLRIPNQQTNQKLRKEKTKKFSFNEKDFDKITNVKKKISPQQISIKVIISAEKAALNISQNTQYYWSCNIVNQSKFSVPNCVFIKDFTTKKLIQLNGMQINQQKIFKFGPYSQPFIGKFTHLYQIIMTQSQQICYSLSQKFGFVSNINRKLPIKQISNKMYERVNKLRDFTSYDQSTQNLILKLKQIGINQISIENFNNQTLVQMFQTFNQA